MGQKVSPIGLRIGINKDWESRWYAPKAEFKGKLSDDIKIRKYVEKNELKLVLRDSSFQDAEIIRVKNIELQRKVLVYRYYGYSLEEIADKLKVNVHKLRYVLRDDSDDTPLGKIKIIFQDRANKK